MFPHITFTFYYFAIQKFNPPVQHNTLIPIDFPPGSYLVDPFFGLVSFDV